MELKPSHEVFAKAVISGKSLTASYAQAYPNATYKSCRQLGSLLSRSANMRKLIRMLLDENGLGLEACIRKLNALTEAERFHHYKSGIPVYVPDNYVRLQSIQTALKIHAMLGNVQTIGEEGS